MRTETALGRYSAAQTLRADRACAVRSRHSAAIGPRPGGAVGLALAASALLSFCAHVHADAPLTDHRDNAKWTVDAEARTATIDADADRYPQIEFDMAAAREAGAIELRFNTDADYVYVFAGRRRERVQIDPGDHTFMLDVAGKRVTIDGEPAGDELAEDWKNGVASDRADGLGLRFGRIEQPLKLNWTLKQTNTGGGQAGADDGAGVDGEAGVGDAGNIGAALGVDELRNRAAGAVVELQVQRGERPTAAARVPAIIVERGGLAIAPLAPLADAQSVKARIAGAEELATVEPLAFDADANLAVVKIIADRPMFRAMMRHVEPAADAPAEDQRVYLAAYDGQRHALEPLTVESEGAVSVDELNRRLREMLGHGGLTRWIELSRPVGTDQGGAAVLNDRGQLVGVAVWTWGANREGLAIDASHVRGLLEKATDATLMTWPAFDTKLEGLTLALSDFPTLTVVQREDPEQVKRLVSGIEKGHVCSACDGNGYIARRVRVGWTSGGGMRKPIMQTRYFDCDRCEATGLRSDAAVVRGLENLATAAGTMDAQARDANQALQAARDALRTMALNHDAQLVRVLTERARVILGQGQAAVGQPIAVAGDLVRGIELPGRTDATVGVVVGESRRDADLRTLVDRPVLMDAANGDRAIVVGILAGYVKSHSDKPPAAVISHAIVVPYEQDQIVVRKTAEELNEEKEEQLDEARREYERRRDEAREREREEERDRERNRNRNDW